MIVICIDRGSYHLTVGKKYEVTPHDGSFFDYNIKNDIGYNHGVEENLFKPINEFRKEKLKRILCG